MGQEVTGHRYCESSTAIRDVNSAEASLMYWLRSRHDNPRQPDAPVVQDTTWTASSDHVCMHDKRTAEADSAGV